MWHCSTPAPASRQADRLHSQTWHRGSSGACHQGAWPVVWCRARLSQSELVSGIGDATLLRVHIHVIRDKDLGLWCDFPRKEATAGYNSLRRRHSDDSRKSNYETGSRLRPDVRTRISQGPGDVRTTENRLQQISAVSPGIDKLQRKVKNHKYLLYTVKDLQFRRAVLWRAVLYRDVMFLAVHV